MSSVIAIECENCQQYHELEGNEFKYEQVDSEPGEMGPQITYKGYLEKECSCGQSMKVTYFESSSWSGVTEILGKPQIYGATQVEIKKH